MSYRKRSAGILMALCPFILALCSLSSGEHSLSVTLGIIAGWVAFIIAVANFWLSVLRPFFWEKIHGDMSDYQFISGCPGVGTLLAVLACLLAFGATTPAVLAMLALLLDTSGLPWFVFYTWDDQSLWDTEA